MKYFLTTLAIAVFPNLYVNHALSQNHYPMEVGNRWQYIVDYDPTWIVTRTIIGDTVMPNGKSYAMMAYENKEVTNSIDSSFYREDSGKVYQYALITMGGVQSWDEFIVYDFSKKRGDTVSILPWGEAVRVSRIYSDTIFSIKRTIYGFARTWSTDYIADSLGLISALDEPPYSEDISGATINGKSYGTLASFEDRKKQIPTTYTLPQNYPNPFNPSTEISYTLEKSSFITLAVYDILGREVAVLVNGKNDIGEHSVTWDARNVPSGMYFYRLNAGSFVQTKKMLLLR